MDDYTNPDREKIYQALTVFARYPTEHLVNKWMRLAEEAFGVDRTVQWILEGHAAGKRLHPLLIAAWERSTLETKAEVRISVKDIEATMNHQKAKRF